MANPQKENGYTPVANEIMDAVIKNSFTATQLKIILVCWRYMYGFSRKEAELSVSFISKATGISKRYVSQELKTLIDTNVIDVIKNPTYITSRIVSFNKNYEQWQSRSTVPQLNETSTVEPTQDTTVEPQFHTTGELEFHQDKQNIKQTLKQNIYSVFNHWNTKNIIVHKKLTDKIKRKISGSLEAYSVDDLKKAIDNYNIVLKGNEYYWSYKWTLEDFLQRGIEKFLTDACFQNYKNQDKPQQKSGPVNKANFEQRQYSDEDFEKLYKV